MSKKKRSRPEPESLGLSPVGVDTHAHLDFPEFLPELETVLRRAKSAGVKGIGQVFLGADAYDKNQHVFASHPEVFFLLGVHPHEATTCSAQHLSRMKECFAKDARLKGLGEIGLDFYYDKSPRDVQRAAFKDQLLLAKELDLPVIIHSREAEEDVLNILEDQGFSGRPVLWHCFGGGRDLAQAVLTKGWHVSIPGTVTFKKNTPLQESVASIPLDQMVLETDCPFLTPDPYRGKRNEPALVVFTAKKVAEVKGMDVTEVWQQCGETAEKFFSL